MVREHLSDQVVNSTVTSRLFLKLLNTLASLDIPGNIEDQGILAVCWSRQRLSSRRPWPNNQKSLVSGPEMRIGSEW